MCSSETKVRVSRERPPVISSKSLPHNLRPLGLYVRTEPVEYPDEYFSLSSLLPFLGHNLGPELLCQLHPGWLCGAHTAHHGTEGDSKHEYLQIKFTDSFMNSLEHFILKQAFPPPEYGIFPTDETE